MNKEIVEKALNDALYLLNSEFESITDEDLKVEYLQVIDQIEKGLNEIEKANNRGV